MHERELEEEDAPRRRQREAPRILTAMKQPDGESVAAEREAGRLTIENELVVGE